MKTSKTYRLSKETLAKIGALQILFNGTTETQLIESAIDYFYLKEITDTEEYDPQSAKKAEKYFYEHRK